MNPHPNKLHLSFHKIFLRLLLAIIFASSVVVPSSAAEKLIPLKAGPVSMLFDAENVFLRYIRVGNHEILRGINAPIRNENWATISPHVSNLNIKKSNDSFQVTFDVACQRADIDFRWKGVISGNSNGQIEFKFDGTAHSTFKKNRIGFCVLHGPAAAGQPWLLETVDGQKSEGHFPKFISAHQPAKNLQSVTHQVAPGIRARVAFEGDVFEMEDQRNWTDASFKTYCTPLELPYPVELSKGTKISQKITIQLEGQLPKEDASSKKRTVLTIGDKMKPLPKLGLQVSDEVPNLSSEQIKRLKALNLDHLRVDLNLSDKAFVKEFKRAASQSKALGVSLQVVIGLGESPDFPSLAKTFNEVQPAVTHWLIRGGAPSDFELATKQLATISGTSKIGVTRVTNFVDLNRARPTNRAIQAIGFAINPQIHAFDNASIVETLPIQADVVQSARQFTGKRPIIIGPITLAPQLLDGVDQPGGPPQGGDLPTHVDARQVEPFTAVWTLGSIKYLADAGTDSATFFETVGWKGILDADNVSSRPKSFPSKPGELFPVYHLLREFSEFKGGNVRTVDTSDPLAAVGVALQKPGLVRILIGNLTNQTQAISLQGAIGKSVDVQLLGAGRLNATPELPITLPPYGIARIDRVID